MELFTLTGNNLVFTCLTCGKKHNQKRASQGCCINMFKVSKINFTDPYRKKEREIGQTSDDNIQINDPGNEGTIGESGLGPITPRSDTAGTRNQVGGLDRHNDTMNESLYEPQAGSPFDDKGVPSDSSGTASDLLDNPAGWNSGDNVFTDSAFTQDKQRDKAHGVHNMPRGNTINIRDIFHKVRDMRRTQI